jgi:hypothetical protein
MKASSTLKRPGNVLVDERLLSRERDQKLTLSESAEKTGCDVEDIRDIRNSAIADLQVLDLFSLARKLGFAVKIDVSIPGDEGRKLN